ncbi:hypothetical protein [Gloeocapsopsis dulcis]|uniref:Uncharacterized protein n=1 Tax=Gloeocapsopsis dulcis AAB1 = 1H9 TaxID=1433147 RepID=A0A6N8G038_9CHRO|nr:hypothetical protein [Gloeocapsopsis dulcis]MUL37727.1 hypothetical protein [Gloeocapsopsis dulcis AAB1 = 1H9]WNN88443.1 hypothetical protein P0S91_19475 [Gloeocapsopsis dulcis]
MIGFIKNIFSGILSFFIGLVGGKKSQKNQPSLEANKSASTKKKRNNGYFMELDEAEEMSPVNGQQVKKALEPITAKLNEVANEVAQKAEPITAKLGEVANEVAQKAEPVTAKLTEAVQKSEEATPNTKSTKAEASKVKEPASASKSTKSSKTEEPASASKSTKSSKTEEPASATKVPKVQLEQTAEGVKPVPAKPAASSKINKPQTETTFAPKYLNPTVSSNGRRRPGPNMNSFLDMARQVKTPG